MARPTKSEEREGLVDAVVEAIAEHGFGGLTIEDVTGRAGVSRDAFHAAFPNREAAVEAAHEVVVESFRSQLAMACEAQSGWPLKVKVGIGFALDYAAASPACARFLTLESLSANREIALRTTEARDQLARLLATGRRETPGGANLPSLTEQMLIGGLIGIISLQLGAGEAKRLPELAPQLVHLTLMPYLGAEEAAKVARRPKPRIEAPFGSNSPSPRSRD